MASRNLRVCGCDLRCFCSPVPPAPSALPWPKNGRLPWTAEGRGSARFGRCSEPPLPHREKLFAALTAQRGPVEAKQWTQCLVDRGTELFDGFLWQPVGAAERLGNDLVDHPQPQQILGGQAQRFRRFLGVLTVPPQDRGAALGRDHRI